MKKSPLVVVASLVFFVEFLFASDPAGALAKARLAIAAGEFNDAIQMLQGAIPSAVELIDAKERHQALGALHFYSALAFFRLQNETKVREELEQFFIFQENATRIDSSKYEPHFVALFDEVGAATRGLAVESFDRLYPGYGAFSTQKPKMLPLDRWRESPEFVLLATKSEKQDWMAAHDDERRHKFVERFWKRRDPSPDDDRNEFREQFDARIAFADYHFASVREEKRGSLTDRGRVFILLGKPGKVKSRGMTPRDGRLSLEPSALYADATLEVWHYLREQLPVPIPQPGVWFRFITQRYHGDHVLHFETTSQRALMLAAERSMIRK